MRFSKKPRNKTQVAVAVPDQAAPPVPRQERLLSNVAAEFVELKAGQEIVRRATGDLAGEDQAVGLMNQAAGDGNAKGTGEVAVQSLQTLKFVSGLDRFMPADEAPNVAEYYKRSEEMMETFKQTLKRFTETLRSRKMFRDIDLEDRDPASYDLAYVLKLAESVKDHTEGLENTQTLKRFVRKCFRSTNKHKTTITCLLGMVPSDLYGSVISGGFSLILAAVEHHEDQRVKVQAALANIPRKLDEVKQLLEVYIMSPRLHQCADELFLSIFVVLERIIDKISKTFMGKFKRHTFEVDVDDAIQNMQDAADRFKGEVDLCAHLRLGRLAEGMEESKVKSEELSEQLKALFDLVYRVFTSGSDFNPKDGSLIRQDTAPSSAATAPDRRIENATSSLDMHKKLIDDWLDDLSEFDPMPEKQISECLDDFASLSLQERDRAQWILASDEVKSWLDLSKSRILNIQANTAPETLANALSFSAATLACVLERAGNVAVLSFFCGLRSNESRESEDSGPEAIRTSFNGQLLNIMANSRRGEDLSFLGDKKLMRRSRKRPKYAARLFREQLRALPKKAVVFIILDSFSRLGGGSKDQANGDKLIEELGEVVREMRHLVIKVLVTDAMPLCPIQDLADLTLDVPDDVDGWTNDLNLTVLDEETLAVVGRSRRRREQGFSSSGESWGGFDSDSDSDTDID